MHIFQRIVTLRGGPRRSLSWAQEMTEFVNDNSDVDVSLWMGLFGFPLGTVAWTARVDSRAHLAEVMGGLMGHDGYHDLIDEAQEMLAEPGEDHLLQLIHPSDVSGPPPVGAVVTHITATPAEGKIGEAMGWGAEIASMYSEITGTPAAFYREAYGSFGQLTWIATHSDMAAVDAAEAALQTNPDYLKSIDGAGDLFVAGSGVQALATRVA